MKKENKFVLPEKWYIIVNEENKIKVNNWYFNGDTFLKPYLHICGMVKQYGSIEKGYNELPNIKNGDGNDSSYDFGIEITFEQFKEHVLKDIPKPEYDPKDVAFKNEFETKCGWNKMNEYPKPPKKIIGYKLIKPEYKEAAKIIALSHVGEKIKYYKGNIETIGVKNGAPCKKALEEAGVLSLWFEPIYDTSITLKSGVKL